MGSESAFPLGQALTRVRGGAWVWGAEPDQGQQHKGGGQKHRQQVEDQEEAKKGEVGLDSGAEQAYGETSRWVKEALSPGSARIPGLTNPAGRG